MPRWQHYALMVVFGVLGVVIALVGYHLYLDHLLIDNARENAIRQQQQMAQPPAEKKLQTVP